MRSTSSTKERPILFSGPLVRAIAEGGKTQTRRTAGLDALNHDPGAARLLSCASGVATFGHSIPDDPVPVSVRCPYGQPGGRLWVRETWRAWALTGAGDLWRFEYQADGATSDLYVPEDWTPPKSLQRQPRPWVPSIFLPRFASRCQLELDGVRAERVQSITEEDALAEGVEPHLKPFTQGYRNYEPSPAFESVQYHPTARESFGSLWRSINGPESWDANPWTWALTFRRITP